MKSRTRLIVLCVAALLTIGGLHPASAQDPQDAPAPAPTPIDPASVGATTVYLRKDYTDALKADGLFDSDKFVARFVGFQGDFVVFTQRGAKEQIYIPKSVILYMRGPGAPSPFIQN